MNDYFQAKEEGGKEREVAIKRVALAEASEEEANSFRNEVQHLQSLHGKANDRIIELIDYEERYQPEHELIEVLELGQLDLNKILKKVSAKEGNFFSSVR